MRHDLFVQHVEHTLRAVDCRARADLGLEEKGQQIRPAPEVQHVHIQLRPDCPDDGPGDIMRHPYPARVFASRHEYKRIGREYDEYGDVKKIVVILSCRISEAGYRGIFPHHRPG